MSNPKKPAPAKPAPRLPSAPPGGVGTNPKKGVTGDPKQKPQLPVTNPGRPL